MVPPPDTGSVLNKILKLIMLNVSEDLRLEKNPSNSEHNCFPGREVAKLQNSSPISNCSSKLRNLRLEKNPSNSDHVISGHRHFRAGMKTRENIVVWRGPSLKRLAYVGCSYLVNSLDGVLQNAATHF